MTTLTRLPDLLQQCTECSGVGVTPNPDFETFWERHGKDCPRLDCLECRANPEESACIECEGRGRRPTEAGAQILELLYTVQPTWFRGVS